MGGSGLVDVEADSPEGEKILDDRCRDLQFPCYRSKKSKHRLFQAAPNIEHLTIPAFKIEFRAGRHVSILPPSVHASEDVRYEWLTTPFDIPPPPLPESILALYAEHSGDSGDNKNKPGSRGSDRSPKQAFPFRDNLDYVLRHLDVLQIAAEAGVEFLGNSPDINGNIPCYVPAVLRGGDIDEHPSGIFNIFSGVLRDFATGRNHRFFDLIGTLTGENWLKVFRRFEKQAGAQHGHPHSRRIALPGPSTEPEAHIDLAEARRQLQAYIHEQLARPPVPGRLHLIKGPPGVGKTTIFCQELATLKTPAIMLTLENRLAAIHAELINKSDAGAAQRMPVLRESGCPYPAAYEAMSRLGYRPCQGYPCQSCEIGPGRCRYLLSFSSLTDAAQLCCAAVYHTHSDFYRSYGNENRKTVIFDENCLDLLLSPVSHPLSAWRAWADLLGNYPPDAGPLYFEHVKLLVALVEWLDGQTQGLLAGTETYLVCRVPEDMKRKKLARLPSIDSWLHSTTRKPTNRRVPNLHGQAIYLLTEPNSHVLLTRTGKKGEVQVRFRRRHPLPADKEVFILDATADEDLLRAVAIGWDVRVWSCPPIAQEGQVLQIMDYDVSRSFIRREVRRHRQHSPCWTVQVIDAILAQADSVGFISFKKVATDRLNGFNILGLLQQRDKIKEIHHFPCRGISVASDVLVVLGTPYKDDVTVRELSLAIYGLDACQRGDYRRRYRQDECFVAGNMGYGYARLDALESFLVSGDLGQAVGRVRPLQRPAKVYVISNAPIPDWEVTQVCASELFDLRRPLRTDAAQSYDRYVAEALKQFGAGQLLSNTAICRVTGIKARSGRTYMRRFREEHGPQVGRPGKQFS